MPHLEMKWAATTADAKMLSSAGIAPTDIEAPACPNGPTLKRESLVRPGGSR